MRISINCKRLSEALTPTLCALTPKSALSVLSSVRLEADQEAGTITLTGYDLQKGVTSTVECEVTEGGCMLIDGNKLSLIVKNLPGGEMTLESDENYLTTIASGMSKFEISGSSGSDFPTLPTLSGDRTFEIKQNLLRKMLQQVLFSYALTDDKPTLTGVYFSVDERLLEICTCDGYRISLARRKIEADPRDEKGKPVEPDLTTNFSDSFLVPGKNIAELFRLLEDSDEKIRIELARKHAIFCFADKIFFSRLLDGTYLNFHGSMPKEYRTKIRVNLSDMIKAVERAGLLTEEKIKTPMRFGVGEKTLDLKCASAQGRTHEIVDVETEGDQALLGFNHRYLADALRGAAISQDEVIELRLNAKLNGLLIKSTKEDMDDDEYLYLVLPVMLNN